MTPLVHPPVISSTRICLSVYSSSEDERHDFTVGPVAHFGQMVRTAGCACIENGQLELVQIYAELETAQNVNILLRSAQYCSMEFIITPETTELGIDGVMYLSLVAGADMEMSGSARFTIDRAQNFVEGEINGQFSTSAMFSGLSADGSLEWHLGAGTGDEAYQSLQGRLGVEVVGPISDNGVEGGFYIGINAPKSNAWILADAGGRFSLNMSAMPDNLTGVYGYVRVNSSVNLYVVSGGVEVYAGLGAFVNTGNPSDPGSGLTGLPYVVGNVGVHIWGKILGGLVSAGAWGNLPDHYWTSIFLPGHNRGWKPVCCGSSAEASTSPVG